MEQILKQEKDWRVGVLYKSMDKWSLNNIIGSQNFNKTIHYKS